MTTIDLRNLHMLKASEERPYGPIEEQDDLRGAKGIITALCISAVTAVLAFIVASVML